MNDCVNVRYQAHLVTVLKQAQAGVKHFQLVTFKADPYYMCLFLLFCYQRRPSSGWV